MLAELIALVAALWKADSEIRENSILGESDMDRKSRRWVSIGCGTMIALLVMAGMAWVWITW